MGEAVLKIRGMKKSFGAINALENLSLEVGKGEIYGFLGPNGAGKTTTLRCCAGLLKPDSGRVEVAGEEVTLGGVEFRRRMAYIPDRPFLYEKLTAWEYLNFVASARELSGWEREASERMEYLGISDSAHRMIEGFSHGMKQKLVIVSSLLHSPELLLVDEPMVGLDPRSARKVKELFKELASRGSALMLSTHSLDMAQELAGRIGIVNRGTLVAEGTMDQLRRTADAGRGDLESVFLKLTEETEVAAG